MRAFEAILDHVDGVVVCLEAKTLKPVYASAAARRLVGEPLETWRDKPACWRRLFDPEDWPRIARLCHAVARDGRRRWARHLVRNGAGRPRSFRTSVSLLPPERHESRLLAHMLDLTDEDGEGERIGEEFALRELLRQAPLSAFMFDGKGVVRLAEGNALSKIEIDHARVLGRSMLRGRWRRPWIVDYAKRVLAGEAFGDVANVDGGWVSLKYVPLRDRRGRLQGGLGFATDITECKRAVDLIGTIDAVLWQVHGRARHLSLICGAARKLFGEDPDPWLGHPGFPDRHLLPEERRGVVEAIEAVTRDGAERTIAHRIRRRDGAERWCRTTLRAAAAGPNGRAEVVGLMLDVTERKTIERALMPRDRRWQIVAEQAPVIVYTVDRDLCITSGIGAGLAALGLHPTGTLIGVPIEQYFHTSGARPLIEAHRSALAGATVRTRARWRRRTYELRLEPLRDEAGAIIGVIGVALDATVQTRRERTRERMLEAERVGHAQANEAVQMRDQLFSIASHELRTPLATLVFTLQAARAAEANPDVTRKLQLAERQAQRLNRMIEQLLDASRLTAGHRLKLEPEELDLAELTRHVLSRFEPELNASKTAVAIEAPRPVVGRWDRTRLDQVITNLVSNAVKYGRGQPVEIAVDSPKRGRGRLSVRDHGVGIPAADQRRLFQPFQRLHGDHQYSGFGLGLYIVSEIVRAHGGKVRIESEVDQGAQFTVELPTGAGPSGSPRPP